MNHSYWIPTNRLIKDCIHSYLAEVIFINKAYSISLPIYVLDSGNASIEEKNGEVINNLKNSHPNLNIHHVPRSVQNRILNLIKKDLNEQSLNSAVDNLAPEFVDYGAVMNKIFLFASALGSNVIHRRDSDTFLQEKCPYPIEKEFEYLYNPGLNNDYYLVGSSYVGEWNLDIKFCANEHTDLLIFASCLNIPEEFRMDFLNSVTGESGRLFCEDNDHLAYENSVLPEAGNFAVKEYFKYFPCLPAHLTLGSDYFIFKMINSLKLGTVFHQRRVVHKYNSTRREGKYLANYLIALMKLCDQSPVYWYLNELYVKPAVQSKATILDLQTALITGLNDSPSFAKQERIRNLENLTRLIFKKYFPSNYENCENRISEIIAECNNDYKNHASLIRNWNKIIQSSENLAVEIKNLLENYYE